MIKKLYSASEVAQMRLAGLPTTKANVIARAEKEGWYFEERTGLGGLRRVYEIPARYLESGDALERTSGNTVSTPDTAVKGPKAKVVGAVAAGSSEVDLELLQLAQEALEEWLEERGLRIDPKRKAAVVAVLYDYLAKGADRESMMRMLKAMTA